MNLNKVVIFGQGYVGLPLAMRAVEVGYEVVGFDVDKIRVDRLRHGDSFIEDIGTAGLRDALESGRYLPTSELEDCRGFGFAVISVPTPLREGLPDLSFIEQAAEMLAPLVGRDSCVVLESTTYPGTTTEVVAPILERGSSLVAGADFHLGYSPERIDPDNATWGFKNTPKLVSGVDADSLMAVRRFYDTLVDDTVEMGTTGEAELAKLLENTFRHVNIALANEMAMVAAELGVNIWEVIRGASTKPFGFMPFYPGPGVGRHCIPVDPSFLSWRARKRLGYAFRFVETADDINSHMPHYVVRRLLLAFNRRSLSLNGSTLLVLGLAYKRDVSDARESPALPVIEQLLELGADIRLADPHVGAVALDDRVTRVEATVEEAAAADGVVVLTDHRAFDLPALANASRYLLDTRHCVEGDAVEYL